MSLSGLPQNVQTIVSWASWRITKSAFSCNKKASRAISPWTECLISVNNRHTVWNPLKTVSNRWKLEKSSETLVGGRHTNPGIRPSKRHEIPKPIHFSAPNLLHITITVHRSECAKCEALEVNNNVYKKTLAGITFGVWFVYIIHSNTSTTHSPLVEVYL